MNISNSIQTIDGQLRRVEHIIYSNGSQVKRVYNSFDNPVPFEVIWVSNPKPIAPQDVIEHREVELLKYYNNM